MNIRCTIDCCISRHIGIVICLLACVLIPAAPTRMGWQKAAANAAVPPQSFVAGLDVAGESEPASEKLQPAVAAGSRSETVAVTVVDEDGRPVAGVAVRVLDDDRGDSRPVVTDDAGVCRIPRPLGVTPLYSLSALFLVATDGSGARQGYLARNLYDPEEAEKPLRIVLKAARAVAVRVTSSTGAAVGDAFVGLRGGNHRDLAHGRTDVDGVAHLQFPADAILESVFAWKAGQGFDFWTARASDESQEHQKVPVALTLNGSQTIRFRVVDAAGKPVSGIAVYPDNIGKPDGTRVGMRLLLHNSHLVDTVTDDQGVATIDWLPVNFERVAFFHIHSLQYVLAGTMPKISEFNVNAGAFRDFTISVHRLTKISGRVTGTDGKPAAGIRVRAESTRYHNAALTAADGAYEIGVRPESAYMVSVVDDDWATQCRGVFVREEQPVAGIDLALAKGTVIRGTVTNSGSGLPAAKEQVHLEQNGDEVLDELRNSGALVPPAGRLKFSRSILTDAAGRFQFRVGPGNYTVTNQNAPQIARRRPGFGNDVREWSRLSINGEPEVVVELRSKGQE